MKYKLITTQNCPGCIGIKNKLKELQIEYTELDYETEGMKLLHEKSFASTIRGGFPILLVLDRLGYVNTLINGDMPVTELKKRLKIKTRGRR